MQAHLLPRNRIVETSLRLMGDCSVTSTGTKITFLSPYRGTCTHQIAALSGVALLDFFKISELNFRQTDINRILDVIYKIIQDVSSGPIYTSTTVKP